MNKESKELLSKEVEFLKRMEAHRSANKCLFRCWCNELSCERRIYHNELCASHYNLSKRIKSMQVNLQKFKDKVKFV